MLPFQIARAMTFGAVDHGARHHEDYGSVYGRAAETLEPTLEEDAQLAQSCQHEETEPEQADQPESYVMALDEPPSELRELLSYLSVSYATFAAHETRYFSALGDHLRRAGALGASDTLSRANFRPPRCQSSFSTTSRRPPNASLTCAVGGKSSLWRLSSERTW